MIKLYNSMTRRKETLVLGQEDLTMYVCGPTLYSAPHIGNARTAVVFDQWFRLFRTIYGDRAKYYRNYTDIDDKIIDAIRDRDDTDLAIFTGDIQDLYESDMRSLNALEPTAKPKATEHIKDMISNIMTLYMKDMAYKNEVGDILFPVDKSKHDSIGGHVEGALYSGERVPTYNKHDPRDFVLWKMAKEGEPYWRAPFGEGRPGWHIECSSMIHSMIGKSVTIHGGGVDLKFPHHEAEIAQSHALHGHPLAKYWLHSGLLTVNGQKMSKSLGNIVLVKDLLKDWSGETIRLAYLMTHYGSPLDWTFTRLKEAEAILQVLRWPISMDDQFDDKAHVDPIVLGHLVDDLNTPAAIARLIKYRKTLDYEDMTNVNIYLASARLLGLLEKTTIRVPDSVQAVLDLRAVARSKREWEVSDKLRNILLSMGWKVVDIKDEQRIIPVDNTSKS